MKELLTIPTFLLATVAMANCPDMPATQPTVPSGLEASLEEMYQAQLAVNDYVDTAETHLNCRKTLHPLQYSRRMHLLETVAESYNSELAKYRAKEKTLASN